MTDSSKIFVMDADGKNCREITESETSRRRATLERLMALPEVPDLDESGHPSLGKVSVEGTRYALVERAEIELYSGIKTVMYIAGAHGRKLIGSYWISSEGELDSLTTRNFDTIQHYTPLAESDFVPETPREKMWSS